MSSADHFDACGAGSCEFEGPVAIVSNPHQERAYWTCPDCWTDHELPWRPELEHDGWRE